jgi:hypothetical protein
LTELEASTPDSIPLRIDSTLQLAWGLTLNFSHEQNEVAVGASLLAELSNLRERYKSDQKSLAYLDNLISVLSSYLRTAGFERDVYASYLDIFKQIRDVRIKNINDASELASLSSGSFILRLGAFLGIGTLVDVVGSIRGFASPTPGFPFNLSFFLLAGVAGVLLLTFAIRLSKGKLVANAINHSFNEQLVLWKRKARPGFNRELKRLAARLEVLVKEYYPEYTEDVMRDKEALDSLINSILPEESLYHITKRRKPGFLTRAYELVESTEKNAQDLGKDTIQMSV